MALMVHDGDRADVQIASREDVRRSVRAALASLGLSYEELERQAAHGRFSSDRARLVWLAIQPVARAST
jgi:hypothetical protein